MTILVNDDFTGVDGALPDSTKWSITTYVYGNVPSENKPKISGNKLLLDTVSQTRACTVFSKDALDFTSGGGVHVKAVYAPSDAGASSVLSVHNATAPNTPIHRVFTEGGNIYIKDSGGYNFSRVYNPTTDLYWRLQFVGSDVQAYVSSTGAAGSWVALGVARPSLLTASDIKVGMGHMRWMGPALVGGVLFDDYQADTDSIATAAAGGAGALVKAISSSIPDGRIFKHSSATWSLAATGNITDSGGYTGFTPNQARLVEAGTQTPLVGFDWATIGTTSAGEYSHTFTGVPQAVGTGWYNVQLRDSANPGEVFTTGKRGVGIHIGVYGQSQATGNANTGNNTLTPTGMSRVHGDHAGGMLNWAALSSVSMNGYIAADIVLNSMTGGKVPIAFLNLGYPGTGLVRGGPNGVWLPTSGAKYQYVKNTLASLEGSADAFVYIAGESDANANVTQSEFYAGLSTLFAATRSDCGKPDMPIVQVILGRAGSYWNDAQGELIKRAQVQKCADANIYRVESYDAELGADNLHRSPIGYAEVARRWAKAVGYALGLSANYRSPRITSVLSVSSTVLDATITYDGATDFTPAMGITGLRVTDSVTGDILATTAVDRQSANTIRVTLSSPPANPPAVDVGYGATTLSNFADNSPLGLPLEYTYGVIAGAYTAKRCTLTLTTDGTTPAASQTGLHWAWYDGAPPNLSSPPVVTGTGATTNGSGVFDQQIDETSLTAGQVGTLLVLVSDGTPGSSANKAFCAPVEVS